MIVMQIAITVNKILELCFCYFHLNFIFNKTIIYDFQ